MTPRRLRLQALEYGIGGPGFLANEQRGPFYREPVLRWIAT